WYILNNTLKLLHPFMPFITEHIWQHLPHEGVSIIVAPWPKDRPELISVEADRDMGVIMDTIKAIRNMRAEVNVPPGRKSEVILQIADDFRTTFEANQSYLKTLAAAEPITMLPITEQKPENAMTAVASGVEIYLPLKGLIDVEKETARLRKELEKIEKELSRIAGKLANEGFVAKAPAEVIEKERAKEQEYREKRDAINERLSYLARL
ncbi:MAG: class I tRNA ligase family protein, partial [Negativicutes bacterium]